MDSNLLLQRLDNIERDAFFSGAEWIPLILSEVICESGCAAEYLHFPTDGFISLVQKIDNHPPLEIGMIGREGCLGAEVILGLTTNLFTARVQGAGHVWRIKLTQFLQLARKYKKLEELLKTYMAVRIQLLGLSAACEHFHEIGPRLAKWLLMSQDRAQSPIFMMTHEFIGLMMGVRRVGITTTASDFKKRGLINYHRGVMQVLDREALILQACSCYQKNRDIYALLMH